MTAKLTLPRTCAALLSAAMVFVLSACGSQESPTAEASTPAGSADPLVIYSGRNENLVAGILGELEKAVGTKVEVRYGNTAELAAQLLEEGPRTEADLFFSQDAGALGALGKADLLSPIDSSITDQVLPEYVDKNGLWAATTARARVIVYNPEVAPEVEKFTSTDQILDPKYKGKVGVAPSNASFQAFVTALRLQRGEEAAKDFLVKLKAHAKVYDGNAEILAATNAGEVSMGLVNHYYLHQLIKEQGAAKVKAKNKFLANPQDAGSLVNIAGVGVIKNSPQADAANRAVTFLLQPSSQEYMVKETSEYPVVADVAGPAGATPVSAFQGAAVDLNQLEDLEPTLALIDEVFN
ncbi:MAG: extracellular solute-binding protein [Propionibacteriaceae bacterium]|nr:extracellular solute-binding protein [Propionibacteriaceae bacterium]